MFALVRLRPFETASIVHSTSYGGGFGELEADLRARYYDRNKDTFRIPTETIARRIVEYSEKNDGNGGAQARLKPLANVLRPMLPALPAQVDMFTDHGEQ